MSLATHVAAALDPAEFARQAGKPPDPWQERALRSLQRPDGRVIVVAGRQTGKSTVAAIAALSVALHEAPALVLLVAPAQDQSAELFKTAVTLYRALGSPVPASQQSSLRLELVNGSRIYALPGSETSARGYAGVKLAVLDEAARIPEELLAAVVPSVATSRGRLLAISTPSFASTWFYETWRGSEPGWVRFHVPSTECRRIPKAFLQEQRRLRGEFYWKTEFLAEFVEEESKAFTHQHVEAALDPEVRPWGTLSKTWR